MKKIGVLFSIVIILLMMSFVITQAEEDKSAQEDNEKQIKDKVVKKGIPESEIENISKLDLNELPKEITLQNIDNTSIALYKVDRKNEVPFFIITAESLAAGIKKPEPIYSNSFLNFGKAGIVGSSSFLETPTGIESSLEKGFVMTREGSIVGISTNLEVLSGKGNVEIIIYKNGEPVGFRNSMKISSSGIIQDHDTESREVVNFKPGDTISAYVKNDNGASLNDIITIIEISSKI